MGLAFETAPNLQRASQNRIALDRQDSLANSGTARRHSLSGRTYNGADAPRACSQGFHTASLWERLTPGALQYDATPWYWFERACSNDTRVWSLQD